jgi:hypothetical protein
VAAVWGCCCCCCTAAAAAKNGSDDLGGDDSSDDDGDDDDERSSSDDGRAARDDDDGGYDERPAGTYPGLVGANVVGRLAMKATNAAAVGRTVPRRGMIATALIANN